LGQPELFPQALVARGLVDRTQIVPLKVLDQGKGQERLVVDLSYYRRNLGPVQPLNRSPAPLSGDQLVLSIPWSHDHRLQKTRRLDRSGELHQLALVDVGPGLQGIGDHIADGKLAQRARCMGLVAGDRSQQGLQSAAQTLGLTHG
jgi:hypothetical protein